MDFAAVAWPVISGVFTMGGTALAFVWRERQQAAIKRREDDVARAQRMRAEFEAMRTDYKLLKDDYKVEIDRLKGHITELETQQAKDKQLLAASAAINEDLAKQVVSLRAEVAVLRSQMGPEAPKAA